MELLSNKLIEQNNHPLLFFFEGVYQAILHGKKVPVSEKGVQVMQIIEAIKLIRNSHQQQQRIKVSGFDCKVLN